ncbi:unnamed protein product [Pleuronectes platessa]|uniref:Uncharacterized protein n=1 Tax=Pleuronectes platessa TaxID=8262 RepID=A0A9N7U0B5_PLEPL|nr:unnamed protein product [Pleuronectes platessa]
MNSGERPTNGVWTISRVCLSRLKVITAEKCQQVVMLDKRPGWQVRGVADTEQRFLCSLSYGQLIVGASYSPQLVTTSKSQLTQKGGMRAVVRSGEGMRGSREREMMVTMLKLALVEKVTDDLMPSSTSVCHSD